MAMIRELLDDGDAGMYRSASAWTSGTCACPERAGSDRDPYAWLRQLGRSAPVIQLQQSDAEGDHHWPFTGSSTHLAGSMRTG